MQPGLDARRAAATLMTAVTQDGALLSEALGSATKDLEPSDKARAQRLATDALRWAPRSDRLLSPYLRNKPEDEVMNLLRLALCEIYVHGAAPHGPVNAAVSLSKKSKAGMVNAVLRNVIREDVDWDSLPVPTLPKWLRKRLVSAWGKDSVAAMERVLIQPLPLDLTAKADIHAVAEMTGGEVLPTGSIRLNTTGHVSALPGFETGDWWVQDAAAALPAKLIGAKRGMRILDLCAAPGGKTMQLASSGAEVTALDQSDARMDRLRENLGRTRLSAECIVADAMEWSPPGPFDAILLDAPCSASGTLRRHPDLAYAKSSQDFTQLFTLQSALIDRALSWLKPDGVMVYCTCSLFPEEGEDQLASALARHPELKLDAPALDWIDPKWNAAGGGLRVLPSDWADCGGIDGFFMVRLRKSA